MSASGFKLTTKQSLALQTLGSDATHHALDGGSRSGKTFLLIRSILTRALFEADSRHAVFRFRFNALKQSVIYDTLPKVLNLCFPELPPTDEMLNKTDWFLRLPNGSEVWFGGLDDKERTEKILGLEFATIFFNECSQIPYASITLAITRLAQKTKHLRLQAYYDLNPPSKKHWTYVLFTERKDPFTKQPVRNEFDYSLFKLNPDDNRENLDPGYLQILDNQPEKIRKRFKLGLYADDDENALWTDELLAQNRVLGQQGSLPDFLRIVVAVDPSGCSGPEDFRSNEIGITVCALGTDGNGYLLEDLSGRYSPKQWAEVAQNAYERHNADTVVGETNFGGAMVEAVIRSADATIPYKEVHASRGKVPRAEPISSLYEQARIKHVGYFPELEDQLCAMTTDGYIGLESPDRGDSAIWGFTELFPRIVKPEEKSAPPPQVKTLSRSASRFDKSRSRRY